MLKSLDLFSGIGGNSLALKGMVEPIAYCEIDKHAQAVLLSRMSDGLLSRAPIFSDIKILSGKDLQEKPDIIVAGFPCQDISVAGKGEGIRHGNRSGLFYQILRLTDELQPTFLFLENVPAIRIRGLDIVLRELTERGYDCRWKMLSAAEVGAQHKRKRWFLLANRNGTGCKRQGSPQSKERDGYFKPTWPSEVAGAENVANPNGHGNFYEVARSAGIQGNVAQQMRAQYCATREPSGASEHLTGHTNFRHEGDCPAQGNAESRLGRLVDGVPGGMVEILPEYLNPSYWQEEPEGVPRTTEEKEQRIERIKRLGNSVVPLQARTAFLLLAADCY